MTSPLESAPRTLLLLTHIVVGLVLLVGTLWPFEATSLLPAEFALSNWPLPFKILAGVAAAICVIADLCVAVSKLEAPQ